MAVEQDRQGEIHSEQVLEMELGYVFVWQPEDPTHWKVLVLRK